MARLVRLDQTKPLKIDPATWPRDAAGNLKPIWICACGLSKKFPLCDGTHKACEGEAVDTTYEYRDGVRVEGPLPEDLYIIPTPPPLPPQA